MANKLLDIWGQDNIKINQARRFINGLNKFKIRFNRVKNY